MGLSRRRQDHRRMKRRAVAAYPDWPGAFKWANHLAGCSCYACGNPRKHFQMQTMQERRAALSLRD